MKKTRASARSRIVRVLSDLAGVPLAKPLTAIEIKRRIPEHSLRTISSTLVKMVKRGQLIRRKGVGPRGGYGYQINNTIEDELMQRMSESIALEIDRKIIEELWPTT